jgi:hypothetical protein
MALSIGTLQMPVKDTVKRRREGRKNAGIEHGRHAFIRVMLAVPDPLLSTQEEDRR